MITGESEWICSHGNELRLRADVFSRVTMHQDAPNQPSTLLEGSAAADKTPDLEAFPCGLSRFIPELRLAV